ncbi:MAG: hypothetical protein R3C01_11675 [Planctomycetaceae bacterium]
MRILITLALAALTVGVAAAAEPFYAPGAVPELAYQPVPALPQREVPPLPTPAALPEYEVLPPTVYSTGEPIHAGFYEGPLAPSPELGICLYPDVTVRQPRRAHPQAVSKIVSIKDPCHPGCCVFVEICAPPCACERVRVRRDGQHVRYDYGRYAVDIITRRNGEVIIDYDGRLL